jgi:hypothetical protein
MASFKPGDTVKIVDSKKDSNLVYTILEIKKSEDGTRLYLLKSNNSPTLLYYENERSHLIKAD